MLAWLAGALGVAGLAKALRKRPPAAPAGGPDPRAEKLRRRLEEARPLADEPAHDGETPVDEAPDPPAGPSREDVHAKARAAIRDMQASGADEGGDAGREPAGDT
jgi:hypothetical protein